MDNITATFNVPVTAIEELAERNYMVLHKACAHHIIHALRSEAESLFVEGSFHDAGIGKGSELSVQKTIRGDNVHWFDSANPSAVQSTYLDTIKELRLMLNRELFLGAQSFECHYAVYPAGTFYKRHLDNFRNTGNRLLSCILYLNENWTVDDGGILRIYTEGDNYVDVLPEAGTLVIFRSQILEHEVLPAKRERYSVTGWLRKDAVI